MRDNHILNEPQAMEVYNRLVVFFQVFYILEVNSRQFCAGRNADLGAAVFNGISQCGHQPLILNRFEQLKRVAARDIYHIVV